MAIQISCTLDDWGHHRCLKRLRKVCVTGDNVVAARLLSSRHHVHLSVEIYERSGRHSLNSKLRIEVVCHHVCIAKWRCHHVSLRGNLVESSKRRNHVSLDRKLRLRL
jgi:hypothetical protein